MFVDVVLEAMFEAVVLGAEGTVVLAFHALHKACLLQTLCCWCVCVCVCVCVCKKRKSGR